MRSPTPSRVAGWRLVPSSGPRLGPWQVLALTLLALIVLAPPTYLAQTGGVLTSGYTIQRLRADRDAWRVRNQQLELELAKARSLTWVETEAVTRLRMQRPLERTIVRVEAPPPSAAVPRTPGPTDPAAHASPRTVR